MHLKGGTLVNPIYTCSGEQKKKKKENAPHKRVTTWVFMTTPVIKSHISNTGGMLENNLFSLE